tara:strand:+ start:358 stop:558 length:201 start_codon:yes stop_codon:yes gene_type:complete
VAARTEARDNLARAKRRGNQHQEPALMMDHGGQHQEVRDQRAFADFRPSLRVEQPWPSEFRTLLAV